MANLKSPINVTEESVNKVMVVASRAFVGLCEVCKEKRKIRSLVTIENVWWCLCDVCAGREAYRLVRKLNETAN